METRARGYICQWDVFLSKGSKRLLPLVYISHLRYLPGLGLAISEKADDVLPHAKPPDSRCGVWASLSELVGGWIGQPTQKGGALGGALCCALSSAEEN